MENKIKEFVDEDRIHQDVRYWMKRKVDFYKFLESCNNDHSIYKSTPHHLETRFISLCFLAKHMADEKILIKVKKLYPELIGDINFHVSMHRKIMNTVKKELKNEFKCPSTNLLDLLVILNS
jgi:hypothetical protein